MNKTKDIQRLFAKYLVESGREFLCENFSHTLAEMDICLLSKSNLIHEFEVKISRSDFHADKKKVFRKTPSLGMGTQRFYCCPTGLLKVEDLPDGWGLIYVNDKLKPKCVHSPYKGNIGERHSGFEKNIKAEHGLMYSALRRLHLRGRIDEIYEAPQP